MSLEYVIFNSLYHKGKEGDMELPLTGFRLSGFADCSHELFWGKVRPEGKPDGEPLLIKDAHTGVVSPINGKAVSGTLLHESFQELLKPAILEAEREIKAEAASDRVPGVKILLVGHVDMDYAEDGKRFVVRVGGKRTLCDIKTVSTDTFEKIVGIEHMTPSSYAALKIKKAIPQANAYAFLTGAEDFTIMWVDKDSLRFKLELFPVDLAMYREGIDKYGDVLSAVVKYLNGDHEARPKLRGIPMCNYCDAYRRYCLGSVKLKAQAPA